MNKFYLLIWICFLSCGREPDVVGYLQYSSAKSTLLQGTPVGFEQSQKVSVVNENLNHRFNRGDLDVLVEDSLLYWAEGNVIRKVNVMTGQMEEVMIPSYELRGKISHLLPINADSIITLQAMPPTLMINDRNGNVLYKEKLPFFDFKVDNPWLKAQFMAYSKSDFNYNVQLLRQIYYDSQKKQVHIPILPVDYNFIGGVEDAQTIGVFDLTTSTWDRGYGRSRGLLRFKGDRNYSGLFDRNYALVKGDTSYISYPISHHVFAVDNRTDELIGEFKASPQNADIIPEPLRKDVLANGDFEAMAEWRNSSPFYDQLVYHETLGLFSRIYYHKKKPHFEKDQSFYWRNRDMTLLVFDEDFNLVSENKLDPNVFEMWQYVPTSRGYLVAELFRQRELERLDEVRLGYTGLYEIKKGD